MNSSELLLTEPLPDSLESRACAVVEVHGVPLKSQHTAAPPSLDALIDCGDVVTIAIANESACNTYGGSRLRIGLQRRGNDPNLEELLRAGLSPYRVVTANGSISDFIEGAPLRAPAIQIRIAASAGSKAQPSTTLSLASPIDGKIWRRVLTAIDMTDELTSPRVQ